MDTGHKPESRDRRGNAMLWLVIGIPAMTVAGCLLTIYLALSSPDELVSDYKLRTDTGIGHAGNE
jgi:hypothetical protein